MVEFYQLHRNIENFLKCFDSIKIRKAFHKSALILFQRDNMKKLKQEIQKKLDSAVELMQSVLEDTSVPRNIRSAVEEALNKISEAEEKSVGISSAIYRLDDISNDINMPSHTRTEIWSIISELESIKEKIK